MERAPGPGSTIDGYLLEEEVGRGGMATVYRARHPALARPVALKLFAPGARLERLQVEARTMARLEHPAIVPVRAVGVDPRGRGYLVMDWVEGRSLEARLERSGPLSIDEAREVALRVSEALAHAHARGVLHRDLKPANLLERRQDGRVLLADFGLARDLEDPTRLSHTGQLLGTPGFAAPEQLLGAARGADPRVDVYGLGATLYALLTGVPPFGGSLLELVRATIESPAPRPSALRREVPAALDEVVARCLEKAPDARYPDMAALHAALERAGAGARSPGRRRWTRVAGASLALLLPALVGALVWQARARAAANAGERLEQVLRAADARAEEGNWPGWRAAVAMAVSASGGDPLLLARVDERRAAQRGAILHHVRLASRQDGLQASVREGLEGLLGSPQPGDDPQERAELRLLLVRYLRQRGLPWAALEHCPDDVSDPAQAELMLERELLLERSGDEVRLERQRELTRRLGPAWARELSEAGRLLGRRPNEALDRVRAALRDRPEHLHAQRLECEALLRGGQLDPAAQALERARRAHPLEPELPLMQARLLLHLRRYDRCAEALDELVHLTGHRLVEPVSLATRLRLFELLDPQGVIAQLDRALASLSEGPAGEVELLLLRGLARRAEGDPQGALADWQRARQLDLPRLTALARGLPYGLGPRVLHAVGEPVAEDGVVGPVPLVAPEAQRRAVLSLLPPDLPASARPHLERAYLLAREPAPWEAIAAALAAARAAAPDQASSELAAARLLVLRERLPAAREVLQGLARASLSPAQDLTRARLECEVLRREGRYSAARQGFLDLAARDPAGAIGLGAAAEVELGKGELVRAAELAERALELDPAQHLAGLTAAAARIVGDGQVGLQRLNALWATTGYLDARVSQLRAVGAIERAIQQALVGGRLDMQAIDLGLSYSDDARFASAGPGPALALLTYLAPLPAEEWIGRERMVVRLEREVRARGGADRPELELFRAVEAVGKGATRAQTQERLRELYRREPCLPLPRPVDLMFMFRWGPKAVDELHAVTGAGR